MSENMKRRTFLAATAGVFASGCATTAVTAPVQPDAAVKAENLKRNCNPEILAKIDMWEEQTDRVTADIYSAYLRDGNTRGHAPLETLERGFERILREVKEVKVESTPAVWSVYNMGYIVKTPQALFSIDLVHRCAPELEPLLDFALITHNHGDHFHCELYRRMNGHKKTVISNFLDNYGAADWRKGGAAWAATGGYTRAQKVFKIKDVEIGTSLIDHNDYLVDFTTAFEIKCGNFKLYHTGDSGKGTEHKLFTRWGEPDLWLFFPGCGINVEKAVGRIRAKRIVFGHLWELGHRTGRLKAKQIKRSLNAASTWCGDVAPAFWGDRVL